MMNSYGVIILFIISSVWSVDVHGRNNNFIITNFGGISDGKTDNKRAFAKTWKKACNTPRGTLLIPKGTFLVTGGDFVGPCNGRTQLRVDGTLMAGGVGSGNKEFWLQFRRIDNLTIFGTGTLNGNGASTWSRCKSSANCGTRPTSLKLIGVRKALIQGLSLVNSKMFQLQILGSRNVKVKKVHIKAPYDSPNTDGIHVSRSNYVRIMNSFIGTGDDCVSLGPGSKNVKISGVFCGPGHGISIGSLGKYTGEEDVSGITVRNCTLSKTDNGLRIKTWAPSKSSTLVSNVIFSNIILESVENPILIDQHYCPHDACSHNGGESSVAIRGVTYAYVRGTSSEKTAVKIQCSKSKPCQNIDLTGVKITYNGQPTTAVCSTVDARFKGSNQIPRRCS